MKVRKSAVTPWTLVLLGMVIVSGCGPVAVETPVPTPNIAATVGAAVAAALTSQPAPDVAAEVEAAVAAALASQPTPNVAATAEAAVAAALASQPAPDIAATAEAAVAAALASQPSPDVVATAEAVVATAMATQTDQVEPSPDVSPPVSPDTTTHETVDITGLPCRPDTSDTSGDKIWLPQMLIDTHFTPLGVIPPFSAWVQPRHPQTGDLIGNRVLLQIDSYDNSQGMTDWERCALSMKKSVRQVLCAGDPECDLDEIVYIPINQRDERTLRFEIEGQ